MSLIQPIARTVGRMISAVALAAIIASFVVAASPRRASACGGTPPPPPSFCGKGYAFGKVSPGTVAVPAGSPYSTSITTWHYLTLIESNPMMPVCPPPPYSVTMTITIGNCLPGGPGLGPIVVGPFAISPGLQTIVVPVVIPAGPPRSCTIAVSSTVTFTDGTSIGPLTGDAQICLVEELPGQPGVPRLDLELISPAALGMHAGDQAGAEYVLTNNDPLESWTGVVSGDFRNTAKQPGESPPGPVRQAFALADPGPGDNWPIEFGFNLPPNGCIPLPPDPQNQLLSEITSPPITLLPGESTTVEIIARPWGMCADGSCGESTVVADGQFSDGTGGLACSGALYYIDNSLPPQFLWDDSGATVLFDPGSLPFEGVVLLQPDPGPPFQLVMPMLPGDFLVNGVPHPANRSLDSGAQDMGPYTGRFVEQIVPQPFFVDSFFDVTYRIEFQPPPTQPQIQTEMIAMDLVGGAPAGFENVAPMAMGLAEIDRDGDFNVDSFFDVFYQVSGYADLDNGDTVPIQIIGLALQAVGPGFDVQLQGVVGPPSRGSAEAPRTRVGDGEGLVDRGAPPPAIVGLTLLTDLRGYARAAPPLCIGDMDGDNDTDVFDFNIFAPAFGTSLGDPGFVPAADLDNNNTIDVFDFNIFAPDFGCPLP